MNQFMFIFMLLLPGRGTEVQRISVCNKKRQPARAAAGPTVAIKEIIEEKHEEVTDEVTEVVANDCPSDVYSLAVKATLEQENIEDTEKENDDLKAEKAGTGVIFSCEICDFHITWVSGLKVHSRKMYVNIVQLVDSELCGDVIKDENILRQSDTR